MTDTQPLHKKLHSVTIKAFQEALDKGYTVDQAVEYFHKELGTQPEVIKAALNELVAAKALAK